MKPTPAAPLLVLALLAAGACAPPDAGRGDPTATAFLEILRAEDARRAAGPDRARLVQATGSAYPALRAAGVRGLGRLESPSVLDDIEAVLDDPAPLVRAEAANALAQAVHRGDGEPALRPLLGRARVEHDDAVLAVVARSLGRLRLPEAEGRAVARALVDLSYTDAGADAPAVRLVGVALGLESLARGADGPPPPSVVARTGALARYQRGAAAPSEEADRVRSVALSALALMNAVVAADVEGGLRDESPEVRRVAAARLAGLPPAATGELIRRSLLDPWPPVRLEAVRALAAGPRDAVSCARLTAAAERDEDTGVRLAALDALARPCPDAGAQAAMLAATAGALAPGDRLDWHAPAHALLSLAAVAPGRAAPLLPAFAAHSNPFVRTYAARAAALLRAAPTLRALLDDDVPNVRTEALAGLGRLAVGDVHDLALAVLADEDDPQVIMTASGLLAAAGRLAAAPRADAALAALERISGAREMTRRDARMALLDVVAAAGDISHLAGLDPYLRDYDPAVAGRAAAIMTEWSGDRYLASPRPSPALPHPSADDLRRMERTLVVLHMARGGAIAIALNPRVAPTNAFRLLTLAENGDLDGLTFHRVVPNFVVQGLSPNANEYAGWGFYTRDEVGLPVQWRGTVGLSTRGRDTGDGQIYVNLVHNTRLDHDYTILGSLVDGLEVVDAVREGDVVERVELRPER